MTQYILSQGILDLQYAFFSYDPARVVLSGFSLGHRREMKCKILQEEIKSLEFIVNDKWVFNVNKEEFVAINPDKNYKFKLEYQDENFRRLYRYLQGNVIDYFTDPNDNNIPKISYSTFRIISDDYLLEIFFNGKIPLKKEDSFWKIDR
jgi:hypothetical protein